MNIFVGNLLYEATGADVKKLFEGFGNVASVAIAMKKEKNTPKSRGFGFVRMPDAQQALAAIATLNGKEFMGRVLNVNPARPKKEVQRDSELEEKGKKPWFSPVFNKPGTYRGGRRTRSYMSRRGNFEKIDKCKNVNFFKIKPRPRSQDNPMRWRKKKDQAKPWQKSPGEHKPWEKVEGGARPWKKAEGESKPWKKPAGDAKPWSKSSGRAQKSRFNPSPRLRRGLGMVRGNGERSRTKGRKKPDGYKR